MPLAGASGRDRAMRSTDLLAPPLVDWPLIGRDGELRLLTELLRRPGARGAVLAGPPGTGRTRLGLEWLAAARDAGFPTARVTASRATKNTPYGAFTPLEPEPGDGRPTGTGDIEERLTAALARLADGGRVALVIDDAQYLDDRSAAFVHTLVTNGLVLALAALRTREVTPEAVTSLWKEGLLERVELVALDGEQVEQLLTVALGGPVDRSMVVRLTARCRGNLVFLRELVLAATAAGTLVREGGRWRLDGHLTPSARLVELVETRLAGLGQDQRLVLAALAAGEVLGPAELGAVADLAVVESLEAGCHILGTVSGRRLEFRLAHPVHGIVIRARFSQLRHRRLLASLAAVVEALGARRSGDVLTLAKWHIDIGDASPGLLVNGAAQAIRQHELALAERLGRAAVAAGGGFDAHLAAARALSLQGRTVEAEADLVRLAGEVASDDERVQIAVLRVENLARMGRDAEGLEVVDAAAASSEASDGAVEVEAARVGLLLASGGPEAAAAAAQAFGERGQSSPHKGVALVATLAGSRLGRSAAAYGSDDEPETSGPERTARGTAATGGTWWLGGNQQLAWAQALAAAGRLAEAQALVAAEYEAAAAGPALDRQAWAATQLADVFLLQGKVVSAGRYAKEAASLFGQLCWPSPRRQALIPLASSLALRGRAEEATAVLADIDGMDLPPSAWTTVELLRARAWTAVAAGDLAAGRHLLDDAVAAGRSVGDRVGESAALHDLARLDAAGSVRDDLAALALDMEGDLAAARASHAVALAAGDATGLQTASACFEALGALLFAAEAAADAAVALRRAGSTRSAAAQERQSASLAEHCEGALTPSLGGAGTRALLSPAERETAVLAAAGRSNKEIADQLYLSVRTVENRLQRVYEKLGVARRADLAQALGSL